MRYRNVTEARFIARPNRFIAQVELEGRTETVHVKNTGRCKELLIPGRRVWLDEPGTPGRKTRFDLIAVEKPGLGVINIDSQAPNKVMLEWLRTKDYSLIRPEYTFGDSRLDFYLERGSEKTLMEVKGCTLEVDGIGYFPDAPTERGVKHLGELEKAAGAGYRAVLAFVIQMEGISQVRPNTLTHPEFGEAMERVERAGVEILFMRTRVTPEEITVLDPCGI